MGRIAGTEVLFESDIFVSPYIFISRQMYKRKPQIVRLLPAINYLLDEFKNKPVIRFCSLKGTEEGFSYETGLDIEVNIRVLETDLDILETVAHELVHSRQFQTQSLVPFQNGYFWFGTFVKDPVTDSEYRALPWEAEAYKKQTPMARAAAKKAGITLPRKPKEIKMTTSQQVFARITNELSQRESTQKPPVKNPLFISSLFVTPNNMTELQELIENTYSDKEKAIAYQVMMFTNNTCAKMFDEAIEKAYA